MSIRSRYQPRSWENDVFRVHGLGGEDTNGAMVGRERPLISGQDIERDLRDELLDLRAQLTHLCDFGAGVIATPILEHVELVELVAQVAGERVRDYDRLFEEYDESNQEQAALRSTLESAQKALESQAELAQRLIESSQHNQRLISLLGHLREVMREEARAGRMGRNAVARIFHEAERRETAESQGPQE